MRKKEVEESNNKKKTSLTQKNKKQNDCIEEIHTSFNKQWAKLFPTHTYTFIHFSIFIVLFIISLFIIVIIIITTTSSCLYICT